VVVLRKQTNKQINLPTTRSGVAQTEGKVQWRDWRGIKERTCYVCGEGQIGKQMKNEQGEGGEGGEEGEEGEEGEGMGKGRGRGQGSRTEGSLTEKASETTTVFISDAASRK
jgi:hypothetical protein